VSVVKPHKRKDRVVWQAYGRRNGKKIYLATFDNEADAYDCCARHDQKQAEITRAVAKAVAGMLRFHADQLDPPLKKRAR